MSIPDSYYKSIWAPNLWLPKAIAIHESAEDPLAVGDGGDAIGLFQMHWSFIETWLPLKAFQVADLQSVGNLLHWSPGIWALALRNFLAHHQAQSITVDHALRIFHYGHEDPDDPDRYVYRVESASIAAKLSW